MTHDLHCGCHDPARHLISTILEKSLDTALTTEQKDTIKKCLITGEDVQDGDHTAVTATDHSDEILEDGLLDNLFAQPFDEEDEG